MSSAQRIALVSTRDALRRDDDLFPLETALREAGAAPVIVCWDDAAVDQTSRLTGLCWHGGGTKGFGYCVVLIALLFACRSGFSRFVPLAASGLCVFGSHTSRIYVGAPM